MGPRQEAVGRSLGVWDAPPSRACRRPAGLLSTFFTRPGAEMGGAFTALPQGLEVLGE